MKRWNPDDEPIQWAQRQNYIRKLAMERMAPPAPPVVLEKVTRITLVLDNGLTIDQYDAFANGVELHLQDDGRTLKVFPRREEN